MSFQILTGTLVIQVHNQGEYGTFFVRELKHTNPGRSDSYSCNLAIHSSFGSVGYYWGNMGCPAHRFLAGADRSYFLSKLFADRFKVYDGKTAMQSTKRALLRDFKHGYIKRDDAREAYDDLQELGTDPDEFEWIAAVHKHSVLYQRASEGDLNYRTTNPQAIGLWEQLWPDFVAGLKSEWDRLHPTCPECGAPMPVSIGGLQTHNPGCSLIPF